MNVQEHTAADLDDLKCRAEGRLTKREREEFPTEQFGFTPLFVSWEAYEEYCRNHPPTKAEIAEFALKNYGSLEAH